MLEKFITEITFEKSKYIKHLCVKFKECPVCSVWLCLNSYIDSANEKGENAQYIVNEKKKLTIFPDVKCQFIPGGGDAILSHYSSC